MNSLVLVLLALVACAVASRHGSYHGGRSYGGHRYGGHRYGRSAEPEPEADAEAEAEPGYVRTYSTAVVHPAYYRHPAVYRYGYPSTYYSYGHHLGKRSADAEPEAEAEAEPGYVRYGYGHHGLRPYGYHAVRTYSHYPAHHVYSPYHHLGKRSADAEPEAEAEAEPGYVRYGYGHHGLRPYGY